jgi:hypothetical protein
MNSEIWDAYNLLLLGPDVERLRKLFARYELFKMSLDVPGDIVECGVFKGSGLMLWAKLLQIFCPGSIKRVVGFDLFTKFAESSNDFEAQQVESFLAETNFDGTSIEKLNGKLKDAHIPDTAYELVQGDICTTAASYVAAYPGFRISLLHLDLDLEVGTLAALKAFWPRVVSGGVVIFDEYAVPRWTESHAVDQFFADKQVTLRALSFARTPTSYVIKDRH